MFSFSLVIFAEMREVVRSADKPFLCFRLPYFVIYQGHLLLYH